MAENKDKIEKYLHCIKCKGRLKLDVYEKGSGLIICENCQEEYPIIKDVPRLLEKNLLRNCFYYYLNLIKNDPILRPFFQKKMRTDGPESRTEKLKSETQKQFGYEWNIWKKLPEFAENHFSDVVKKEQTFFSGKIGWDCAIGMGRHLESAAKAVGESGFMLGSDLSFSVDVAYARAQKLGLKNALIVQADLYCDFIADESLDFAYMIGLIQHLTAPQDGMRHVFQKVRPGGYFSGTIYTKPKDNLGKILVAFIYFMRFFTLRLPLPVVLFLSRICALPAYGFFKLPKFILKHFQYIQDMDRLYPTHKTQKRKPDLDLLAHAWFDHFTPPVIGFYCDKEIIAMLENIGLKEYRLETGIFGGYKK